MKNENQQIIQVANVSVVLGGKTILDKVSLDIERGEIFALMGPSGCGKTTLLRCMMGLLVPSAGKIFIDGEDIVPKTEEAMESVRRKMGVAFQGGALFNSISLLDNVCFPLREKTSLPTDEIIAIGRLKLDMVGLAEAANKLPAELSGGMKKRGAIARAMALDPEMLFLDEPTSGLDPLTSAEIDELIKTLNQSFGITVFLVTHDIPSAFSVGTRTAMMGGGKLLAVATPEKLKSIKDTAIVDFIERRPPKSEHSERLAGMLENGAGTHEQ